MQFDRAAIVSGSQTVAGFTQEGQFLGVQPANNYIMFELRNTVSPFTNFVLNWQENFYLELKSIFAGIAGQPARNLTSIVQTIIDTTFPTALEVMEMNPTPVLALPATFNEGILILPRSRTQFTLSGTVTSVDVVCQPCMPIVRGLVQL
ncbi:MAG: hypothetical protein HC935_10735 [Pseudanabaena sp. SU_2_4]|nr:hypothetical protein [Pseudanabaena sp. SU_2_4]